MNLDIVTDSKSMTVKFNFQRLFLRLLKFIVRTYTN